MEKELSEFLLGLQDHPEFLGCMPIGINTINPSGDTPLHIASVRGDADIVSLLIKNGANLNARGEHGYTPLHEASAQGNLEVVKLLVRSGASFEKKNRDGFTPLEIAEQLGEQEIVQILKKQTGLGSPSSPLG